MSVPEVPTRSAPRRFQFSLGWLLILVTVICVLLGLADVYDHFNLIVATLIWCVIPTPLVIISLFDRGDRQSFAIGALIPWLALLALRIPPTGSFISLTIWLLALGGICGTLAAATRRWIARRRTDQPVPSDCPV